MPSAWQVWVELVVPLLGVVSSFAVALAAVWVTLRLARRERAAQALQQRTAWAAAVRRFQLVPLDAPNTAALQNAALAEMEAAAVGLADVEDIADWLSEEDRVLRHSRLYGQVTAEGQELLRDLKWDGCWPILAEWAETGKWSRPTVHVAPEDARDAEELRAAIARVAQYQARMRQQEADGT